MNQDTNPPSREGTGSSADGGSDPQSLLLHNQLLGERLYLYGLARFLVVAGLVGGSIFGKYVVGVEDLDLPRFMQVAAVLAAYNFVAFWLVRPFRERQTAASPHYGLTRIMHGTIMLDFVFLTVTLWLVGGAKSPFLAFYIFHVMLASVLLSRGATFAHAAFGYLLLTVLVLGVWLGWIPAVYPAGAVNSDRALDGRYVMTILVVYGLLFVLSALILTSLMELLRAGERRLRKTNVELERLSAMRRDFLHVALHDLKSPVSAVTTHLYNIEARLKDMKLDQEVGWVERCQIRLQELLEFVHDLEVLGVLETEDIREQAKQVDVAELLTRLVDENQDLAGMHNHALTLELAEDLPPVHAIDRLLHEAALNFITNAIKYTPDGGAIVVRALRHGDRTLRIEVQDNGIGIAPEAQQRLFQEFVRIKHDEEKLGRQPSSSGLGLSIVRRIITAMGGSVGVTSEADRGSTFRIDLPVDGDRSHSAS